MGRLESEAFSEVGYGEPAVLSYGVPSLGEEVYALIYQFGVGKLVGRRVPRRLVGGLKSEAFSEAGYG